MAGVSDDWSRKLRRIANTFIFTLFVMVFVAAIDARTRAFAYMSGFRPRWL